MHIKRKKIKKVIDAIKDGNNLLVAIKRSGIVISTWYKWEQEVPRLEKVRRAAQERCEEFRNKVVEDAFFKRFTDGTAVPVDFIFYLTNRMPERWKDKRAVVNNTNVYAPQLPKPEELEFKDDRDKQASSAMLKYLEDHSKSD